MLSLKEFKEVEIQSEYLREIQGGRWRTIDCYDDNGCTRLTQRYYFLGIATNKYRYTYVDD